MGNIICRTVLGDRIVVEMLTAVCHKRVCHPEFSEYALEGFNRRLCRTGSLQFRASHMMREHIHVKTNVLEVPLAGG